MVRFFILFHHNWYITLNIINFLQWITPIISTNKTYKPTCMSQNGLSECTTVLHLKDIPYVFYSGLWLLECRWVEYKEAVFLLLDPLEEFVDWVDGCRLSDQWTEHCIQLKPWCHLPHQTGIVIDRWYYALYYIDSIQVQGVGVEFNPLFNLHCTVSLEMQFKIYELGMW